jgi:hypothetical protein
MLIASVLLFTLFILFLCYKIGKALGCITSDTSFTGATLHGFVFFLAGFQLLASPILYFHGSFKFLYFGSMGLLLPLLVVSYCIKSRSFWADLTAHFRHLQRPTSSQLIILVAVVLVLLQAALSSYLSYTDQDDSFYVSTIAASIDSPSLYKYDTSTGCAKYPFMSPYMFQSWEVLLAVVSKAFHIAPASLAHTYIPVVLIILSYLSYLNLSRCLLPKSLAPAFIIVLSVFHIMGEFSRYSPAIFLLAWTWMGKSILLHVIIPYLYTCFHKYVAEPPQQRTMIGLLGAAIAGIALNPIAIYMISAVVVVTVCLYALKAEYRVRVIRVLLVLLPLVLYGVIIKAHSWNYSFNDFHAAEAFHPFQILREYWGRGSFFYLYGVGAVVYCSRQHYFSRVLFLWSPVCMCVTLWNPKLAGYVARYLTSYATYWRLLWLLPLGVGIACFCCSLLYYFSGVKRIVFFCAVLMMIIVSGRLIYRTEWLFAVPENSQKLSQEIVDSTLFISKCSGGAETTVLAPDEFSTSMRQISSNIVLLWSRSFYMSEFLLTRDAAEEFQRLSRLRDIYGSQDLSRDELSRGFRFYRVSWVIVGKTSRRANELLSSMDTELLKQSAKYNIYHVDWERRGQIDDGSGYATRRVDWRGVAFLAFCL